jgi:hypothetical protein
MSNIFVMEVVLAAVAMAVAVVVVVPLMLMVVLGEMMTVVDCFLVAMSVPARLPSFLPPYCRMLCIITPINHDVACITI